MKATEAKLLDFLKKSPQFVIPIYQRTYSWTDKEMPSAVGRYRAHRQQRCRLGSLRRLHRLHRKGALPDYEPVVIEKSQKSRGKMAKVATTARKPKRKKPDENGAAVLPMPALDGEHLDIWMLETWLWDAACAIRGLESGMANAN
jgi:hypothetical protein